MVEYEYHIANERLVIFTFSQDSRLVL